ncbi:MAG TPA: protein kinase [Pyrinomonadaceae bacterium]|nr:protein kinase [Pyrinomonadaceae bacterium]
MNFADLVGQTLDSKYKIERQLGRGGMGTVYLATHLGTERPVAVKVIAPQYMERPEFVERFRREARAAGRLRHPNVVNVTDFGFAETEGGRAAYLVMEYLDGCTLGEILEEEKNLPVGWTLNILEQVCSAVHAAHEQGIIHRDLKPDNIWLEPNQRGGYTVKVLDFGIAKLEEHRGTDSAESIDISVAPNPTLFVGRGQTTVADHAHGDTAIHNHGETGIHDSAMPTRIFEGAGVAKTDGSEARTAILDPAVPAEGDPDTIGTRLVPQDGLETTVGTSDDLTRVGAVIGTPLYMSPEQCRGERLDPRSDIYSLGVIAYQMLAGRTPFEGDFTYVMEAHKAIPAPPLDSKKVRKKLKLVIATALEKDREKRPQSAEGFATSLISRSEGIFGLLRRAGMIYTEHIGKFLGITLLLFLPYIVISLITVGANVYFIAENPDAEMPLAWQIGIGSVTAVNAMTTFFCGYLVVGTLSWLVTQILALPLRPVRMRPALLATWRNWKGLIGAGIISTLLTSAGYVLCIIPGFILSVTLALVAPVVMMEGARPVAALKRSKELVLRSLRTTTAAVALLFLVPLMIGGTIGGVVALSVKSLADAGEKIATMEKKNAGAVPAEGALNSAQKEKQEDPDIDFQVGGGGKVSLEDSAASPMTKRIARVARESLTTLIMLPIQILLTSLSSIIVALLYLKTRQAGGESLRDLFIQFEESEHPRKKWQERVRQRLIQSGRITSRPSNEEIRS